LDINIICDNNAQLMVNHHDNSST